MAKIQTGLFFMLPEDIRVHWDKLERYIEHLDGGIIDVFEPDELRRELVKGDAYFLWVGLQENTIEALLLCSFASTPHGVTCWIVGANCTGDLDLFVNDLHKVEKWAFDAGATEMAFEGRKGWLRKLAPIDYKPRTVMLRKSLTKIWSN